MSPIQITLPDSIVSYFHLKPAFGDPWRQNPTAGHSNYHFYDESGRLLLIKDLNTLNNIMLIIEYETSCLGEFQNPRSQPHTSGKYKKTKGSRIKL